MIRVYDSVGNVIKTHKPAGEFKEILKKFRRPSLERKKRMAALQLTRENYVIAPVAGKKIRSRARSLLIVDHLRRRSARLKSATARTRCGELCAHFL